VPRSTVPEYRYQLLSLNQSLCVSHPDLAVSLSPSPVQIAWLERRRGVASVVVIDAHWKIERNRQLRRLRVSASGLPADSGTNSMAQTLGAAAWSASHPAHETSSLNRRGGL